MKIFRKIKARIKKILFGDKVWPKLSNQLKEVLVATVKVQTPQSTLDVIKNSIQKEQKGAYLRFGDGDVFLLKGLHDKMQLASVPLAKEMLEVFSLSGKSIHKALAINSTLFGYEEEMKTGMHLVTNENSLKLLSATHQYFVGQKIFSPVALHYMASFHQQKCIDFLKFIKSHSPIFVGNIATKTDTIEKVFNTKVFIKTPSKNSYSEIDRIEEDLKKHINEEEFKLVVLAMGCSGRVLQKRILSKGYNVYLFDFGSLLDAFDGDESRAWIKLTGVNELKSLKDKI